jgi:hypothetical protein
MRPFSKISLLADVQVKADGASAHCLIKSEQRIRYQHYRKVLLLSAGPYCNNQIVSGSGAVSGDLQNTQYIAEAEWGSVIGSGAVGRCPRNGWSVNGAAI